MSDQLPDPPTTQELTEMLKPLALSIGAAAAGIVWRWSEEVRRGARFTWRRIVLDLCSCVGIGLTGYGIALWVGAPDMAAAAISCAIGHLGAQGVAEMLARFYGRGGNRSDDR